MYSKKEKLPQRSKRPTTTIAFSAPEDMNSKISAIARSRKQSKSTVIKTCIEEALNADLPAEVLLYYELSEILNDKNTTDKKKLSETKKVIKNLMKLRRQCHG